MPAADWCNAVTPPVTLRCYLMRCVTHVDRYVRSQLLGAGRAGTQQIRLIWACLSGPRAPAEDHRPGLWRSADRLAYQVRHAQGTWPGQAACWVRALAPA